MSSRSRIRPRRVYDSNFTISESYYKSALDRLDKKYSGRPTSPSKQSSIPREVAERHAEAFAEEDLATSRRRAEKHIVEDNLFDNIKHTRSVSAALEAASELDQEISSSLLKIQARKKMLAAKIIEDVDMENTFNNLSAARMVSRSEKLLDSVGLNESTSRKMFDEESSIKRRALKMTSANDSSSMTKWTALKENNETSAASVRAKQSRARLHDLEEEMQVMSEKQAAREKRVANLRALMAENAEESQALQVKTSRITTRTEKKVVSF